MGELFAGWRLVPPRLRASWRLLSVTAIGVLAAAVLLAAAPIYSSSLSTLGLQFRLQRTPAESRLSSVAVEALSPGDAVDLARRRAIDAAFEARVGWLGTETLVEERSQRLFLDFVEDSVVAADGDAVTHQPWNAFLFALPGYEQHVTVTEGRLPDPATVQPEVALPDGFQRHAALGDTLTWPLSGFDDCANLPRSGDAELASQERRCTPTTRVSRTVTATVAGFVRPDDPDDPRWEIFAGSFRVPDEPLFPHFPEPDDASLLSPEQSAALAGEGSMPLLTSQEQLFGAFAAAMPYLPMRHRVGLVVNIEALAPDDAERALEGLSGLRADLSQRLGLVPELRFPLSATLSDFRNSQSFEQIPLLIILLQVAGIVVYYVAVVASMLVERQGEELSVYRSRGAGTTQLLGLYLMEGTLIAISAAAAAAWLAGRAVAVLGYTPTFRLMTGGGALPVTVTPTAYLLAAGGAALALLAMLLPAFVAARRGIVDVKQGQSRPPGRNVLQRYYLDLGAVALAGILLWQLEQRGTVFDPRSVGGWSSDPLLLAAPFVFTLAVAALVLRFYPPLLRRVVGALLAARGTAVALGLRRAARAPTAYARLMLLLLMAVSVGTFASSYGATIDRSQGDRIRYAAGPDLRAPLANFQGAQALARVGDVRELEAVDDAAVAHRGELRTATNRVVQVLALDPERAPEMLWFRDDFAEESLSQLMLRLQSAAPSGGGVQLSDDAQAIRLSVRSSPVSQRRLLWARFRDAAGFYRDVVIAPIGFEDWQELELPLPSGRRPLSFVGLRVSESSGAAVAVRGELYIDALKEVLSSGEERTFEDFERDPSRFGWRMFAGAASGEQFELSDEQSVSGRWSAKWSWPAGIAPGLRFLMMNDPSVPLAAIVNPAAAARLGVGPGAEGTVLIADVLVPVSVRAVTEMFPTLDPDRPFMVLNFQHLRDIASLLGQLGEGSFRWPNELWLSTGAPLPEQQALVETLRSPGSPIPVSGRLRHRDGEIATVRADPTLRAAGGGMLTAAFGSVLALSMLGFAATLALDARSRMVEFAVLRAVGSSPLQILRSMALEWSAVLAVGVAIGVLLGRRVASVMLTFLDVTEDGARVVPSFILETDWLILAMGVGALAVVAAVALLISWAAAVRREFAIELRLTR